MRERLMVVDVASVVQVSREYEPGKVEHMAGYPSDFEGVFGLDRWRGVTSVKVSGVELFPASMVLFTICQIARGELERWEVTVLE